MLDEIGNGSTPKDVEPFSFAHKKAPALGVPAAASDEGETAKEGQP